MKHTQQLAPCILDRLDVIRDTDVACVTALDLYADIAMELEASNHALFRRIDAAWIRSIGAVMQAAWKDGYSVGRDPTQLIFAQQQAPAVSMPFTWKVVADGVEIAQTVSEYVDDLLDGEGGAQ